MEPHAYPDLWQRTLSLIQKSHYYDKETFDSWISKTELFKIDNGTAYIIYPTMITLNILNTSEGIQLIQSTLQEILNESVSVQFISKQDAKKLIPEVQLQTRTANLMKTDFNEDYTFENFIEGNSNAEAYAACLSCCTQKNHLFNPIMIYGNSGLGKTHLLHAIGNYLKKERPEAKVFYSYSGDLVTILFDAMKVRSVHGNAVELVKSQLVENDYFLIDDIQNLQSSSSQEVFFTVYNELIRRNAQIVITSDTHPSELKNLPNRLVSRFSSGLAVNIVKPEFDTSKAILKKKLEGNEEACLINEDVLDYLANKFSNDVRNLEGSLNKLIFNATLENPEVIDLDFAQRILMKEPIVSEKSELTIKKIKKAVTRFYGLTYSDIEGKSRQKKLMNARQVFIYLSRELLHKAYVSIGQELGNRDHTTISSSYERAQMLIKTDPNFKKAVEKIKALLEKN
ncbi:chromosomal replication initiator protein DnaA [uncultured Faecalicoccus sp.]|uniref:chromosomal replication initiator protein DnaA n=1 Tax=uncultured Faecalicoccus sp. TaxID=1971760 RepID=UPI0025FD5EAA|nr:chromosomal replication initiator protein DnaA [uncultured Faecalicoccus sp.]